MSAPDLHDLPVGSVVAATVRRRNAPDTHLVAVRNRTDARPWSGAWDAGRLTVGEMLGLSSAWIVLRRGPEVTDQHTGPEPEVRHYIAEIGAMRAHITMTGREDDGSIVTDVHPWEPLTAEGATWYRVSDAVAAEYDWDTDDQDPRDGADVYGPRRVEPHDLDAP